MTSCPQNDESSGEDLNRKEKEVSVTVKQTKKREKRHVNKLVLSRESCYSINCPCYPPEYDIDEY